ncbi:MAG: hypothetical protein K6L80_02155 [Agarilytica sp.]
MDIADSEQFLRQQLSCARLLLGRLNTETGLPEQRALRQSAMLCLELGLSQYFSNIFHLPVGNLQSLTRHLERGAENAPASIPSSEFIELMSQGRWLFEFDSAAASLSSLPSTWNKANASGESVKQIATDNLIASSSASDRVPHWSEISTETLQAWLASAEELLGRYSRFNQEY